MLLPNNDAYFILQKINSLSSAHSRWKTR